MAKKPSTTRAAGPKTPRPAAPKKAGKKSSAPTATTKRAAPQAAGAGSPSAAPKVYTLDVFLLSGPITRAFARKNKTVSRTILVRGDQTLNQLHEAIFAAFDRDDPHMYEFQMGKGPMDPDGPRYVLPGAADDDSGAPVAGTVDATTLDAVGLEVGRQFGYWFDFGDDWHHQVGVEAVEDGPGTGTYPRVVKRVGESLPQYLGEEDEG
jgi:hypothetical protein